MVHTYTDKIVKKDWGPRPAGRKDECFYCKQKIGQAHTSDCVLLQKLVKVTFTVETIMPVPETNTVDEIKFRYGGSSWCANNLITHLEDMHPDGSPCLCGFIEPVAVVDATKEDLEARDIKPGEEWG